jgi:hypothetical protein
VLKRTNIYKCKQSTIFNNTIVLFFYVTDITATDLQQYILGKRNKNTVKKTEQCVNKFIEWIKAPPRNDLRKLIDIPVITMDIYVGGFLMSMKKANGELYEPETLTSYHRAIGRKLDEILYGYDLNKSVEFKTSKKVLDARKRELKQCGKGNRPNKAEPLTEADEERLWETGQMGLHTPESLFNMVWYHNTKLFGFRGSHESRQLKWGDVELKSDSNNTSYIEFTERETKTRTGNSAHIRSFVPKIFPSDNPQRCPIVAYRKFASKRPDCMSYPDSPFYLAVNYKPANDSTWYKSQAMGVERLQTAMSKMAESCGLKGRYTNHSVRKTTCTQLLHAGVAPNNIIQLTGHKNVQSLANYAVASKKQQRDMNDILLGQKRQSQVPTLLALPSGNENGNGNENAVLTPLTKKPRPSATVSIAPTACDGTNLVPALPDAFNPGQEMSRVISSQSRSQHMVAGMFAGAVFNGSVNISFGDK